MRAAGQRTEPTRLLSGRPKKNQDKPETADNDKDGIPDQTNDRDDRAVADKDNDGIADADDADVESTGKLPTIAQQHTANAAPGDIPKGHLPAVALAITIAATASAAV